MPEKIICCSDEPVRLDLFLAKTGFDYTRSFFGRLIQRRGVLVNGKKVHKSGYILSRGDLLEFELFGPAQAFASKFEAPIAFEVIDEQEEFLIINKPPGLLVHSASSRCAEASLVDGLAARFKALKELPLDLRAGLVHRLDKETSGLLLVAKNSSALATLSQLFLNRIIKKTYLAIVKGHPGRAGKVELPLGRHPHVRYKRMAHGLLPKEALTEYKVLQYFSSHAMLELQIKTGRTHQIRVHMASIGHPILGDFLYGQASHLITRQALHAQRLEFCFKGKVYSYEAGLPEDMQQLLGRCEEI